MNLRARMFVKSEVKKKDETSDRIDYCCCCRPRSPRPQGPPRSVNYGI